MRSPRKKSTDKALETNEHGKALPATEASHQHSMDQLQQSAGNQALVGLLSTGVVQRKEKDSASAESRPEAAAAGPSLIVEDEAQEVKSGQMRKSEFLAQLRTAVSGTAEDALAGTMWSAMGCPYIDRWLDHYSKQPSAYLERALQKYAPETASAHSAQEYIPIVTRRVRRGIEEWRSTGEVKDLPPEFASGGMPGATVSGLMGSLMSGIGSAISGLIGGVGSAISSVGSMLFKRHEGAETETREDPATVRAQLGGGQALDGATQRRMQSAFGADFGGVRVHTDTRARELTEGMQARAFTIGSDIAFGGDEYRPGTPVGDALIAHELAHVVQQGGGNAAGGAQHKGGASGSLEEDADRSAVGAVMKLWSGARGELSQLGQQAMPRMRSGLRLQGCNFGAAPKQAGEKDIELGTFWNATTVMKVLSSQGDEDAIRTIIDKGFTIHSVETAFDTWRYSDGKEVETEVQGLRGNTDRNEKKVRIIETLTTQDAAIALVHESGHVARPASQDGPEQEIEVRIATEEFLIKRGWPPFEPEYRNADGTINKEAIRKDIMGSSHYNPQDRKWVRRRWVGEKKVTGWVFP